MKPIKIDFNSYMEMAKEFQKSAVLRLAYGPEIKKRMIGPLQRGNNPNFWVLLSNDDQMRAIVEVLQDKGILPKSTQHVVIPSK